MTEREKLDRDIAGLRETIRLMWKELAAEVGISRAQRDGTVAAIRMLVDELAALLRKLEEA
jgi:hypothetical protein